MNSGELEITDRVGSCEKTKFKLSNDTNFILLNNNLFHSSADRHFYPLPPKSFYMVDFQHLRCYCRVMVRFRFAL